MDGKPESAQPVRAPHPGADDGPGRSRPWTPSAAMEPVPPLAPPPARPGAGARLMINTGAGDPKPRLGTALMLVVAAIVIIALLIVELIVNH